MSTTASPSSIGYIEERIAPSRNRLAAHPLYAAIKTASDLRTFMSFHVFAVWDFMSLLKALQQNLTCVTVPWLPSRWPDSRRFINEIVLGEESDIFEGRSISHFELYLEAMEACGANTRTIHNFLAQLQNAAPGKTPSELVDHSALPAPARQFVHQTFDIIQAGSVSAMAAAFTFGREDLIPHLFRELVRDLNQKGLGAFGKFIWYLERHIEVDGENHGPLSLRMVSDLCGSDEKLWIDAANAAENAIAARLALWDGILGGLGNTH